MSPITSEPATGTAITQRPRWLPSGEAADADRRAKKARLVITAISQRRDFATTAPIAPMGSASRHSNRTLGVVLKSPSAGCAGRSEVEAFIGE